MSARYLVRFDDLCPTMNWEVWTQIEAALSQAEVSPILAIVPDNRDPKLQLGPPRSDFWDQVRRWQERGWTIGLHGYQHTFVTQDSGIVGIAPGSEFAGLPEHEQESKLQAALAIFRREGVNPEVWVAPCHSFDQATLSALTRTGPHVISDGFALAPHLDSAGLLWVPQQLWRFRWRPFGIWTVCYHHNSWMAADVSRLRTDLHKYRDGIINLGEAMHAYPQHRRRILDDVYATVHSAVISLRRQIWPIA